jgi:hypothetical protein
MCYLAMRFIETGGAPMKRCITQLLPTVESNRNSLQPPTSRGNFSLQSGAYSNPLAYQVIAGRRLKVCGWNQREFQRRICSFTLALLSSLTGCGEGEQGAPNIQPQQPNVVSLDPQNWYLVYGSGMPPHPSAIAGGAWSFDFPSSANGGSVNYVQTPFNATKPLHNVSITFRVDSVSPQYQVIDPTDIPPATVRMFFEQRNDDLISADGRWWATASVYNLGSQDNTTLTITIPLTPDQWSNVYGQYDAQSFYASLENVGWIGVTFGGGKFAGHGVALNSGSARYILIDYHVN